MKFIIPTIASDHLANAILHKLHDDYKLCFQERDFYLNYGVANIPFICYDDSASMGDRITMLFDEPDSSERVLFGPTISLNEFFTRKGTL